MAVEIKELIIRALVGRDDDEEPEEETKDDQEASQKNMQTGVSQDTIAMVTEMLNKQKER